MQDMDPTLQLRSCSKETLSAMASYKLLKKTAARGDSLKLTDQQQLH